LVLEVINHIKNLNHNIKNKKIMFFLQKFQNEQNRIQQKIY